MKDSTEARWLTSEQNQTWRSLWSMMTWLPVHLDQQLRHDAQMSLVEYHALSQISEAPKQSVRLSELAQVTNMTLSHLSKVVSRMVAAGWVERIPDPEDGRFTLGQLTDEGRKKVAELAPGHVEAVQFAIFDQLTDEQTRVLGECAALIGNKVVPRTLG